MPRMNRDDVYKLAVGLSTLAFVIAVVSIGSTVTNTYINTTTSNVTNSSTFNEIFVNQISKNGTGFVALNASLKATTSGFSIESHDSKGALVYGADYVRLIKDDTDHGCKLEMTTGIGVLHCEDTTAFKTGDVYFNARYFGVYLDYTEKVNITANNFNVSTNMNVNGNIQSNNLKYQKVASYEATSNVSRFNFTGIDLNKYNTYEMIFRIKNSYSGTTFYKIFYNNDRVDARYYIQYMGADGTGTFQDRGAGTAFFEGIGTNVISTGTMKINTLFGDVRFLSLNNRMPPSGVQTFYIAGAYNYSSPSNITMLSIEAHINPLTDSLTTGIENGSTFELYKIG